MKVSTIGGIEVDTGSLDYGSCGYVHLRRSPLCSRG